MEAYDRNSLRNLAPEPEKKTIYGVQPGDFSEFFENSIVFLIEEGPSSPSSQESIFGI